MYLGTFYYLLCRLETDAHFTSMNKSLKVWASTLQMNKTPGWKRSDSWLASCTPDDRTQGRVPWIESETRVSIVQSRQGMERQYHPGRLGSESLIAHTIGRYYATVGSGRDTYESLTYYVVLCALVTEDMMQSYIIVRQTVP